MAIKDFLSAPVKESEKPKSAEQENIDKIYSAIKSSFSDVKTIKKALDPRRAAAKDQKFLDNLYKKLEKAETLGKKFLVPEDGAKLSKRDSNALLKSYEEVNKILLENQKKKIDDQTLGQIVKSYKDDQNKRFIYEKSLDDKLNSIQLKRDKQQKAEDAYEGSAKQFLLENPASVALKGKEGKETGAALLSGFFPVVGLMTKVASELDGVSGAFGGVKDFFKKRKEKKERTNEEYLLKEKERMSSEKEDGTEIELFEQKEEKDEKRHEETLKVLKRIAKGSAAAGAGSLLPDVAVSPGGLMKGLKSFAKFALKGAGVAAGAYGMYDAYKGVQDRKGESFFGNKEGEKGLMGSRASRYLEGAGSGAMMGAMIGGPWGALIGGVLGIVTTAFADFKPEIMKFFAKIPEMFTNFVDWLKDSFGKAIEFIKELPGKIMEWLSGAAGRVWQGTKNVASTAWEGAKKGGKAVMGGISNLKDKASGLMDFLMNDPDLQLSKTAAAAVTGNLAHESGLQANINEKNPLVAGSRGGFGLAQWTGPRRKQLEAYAASKGMDVGSEDLQRDFLKHELLTTHKGALTAVKKAGSVEDATIAFEKHYEGAGIKHLDSRIQKAAAFATLSNNDRLVSNIETPSIQNINQQSSERKMDELQQTMASNNEKSGSSTSKTIESTMTKIVEKITGKGMSTPRFNLSPDTLLAGFNMGIT
jgi:hypothetical protein